MSQFRDLNSVINSLRYTILLPFIIIFAVIICIWILTIHDLKLKHESLVKQELLSTSKLFESILSQKLKIVATSPEFVRFMESGKFTRNNIEIGFLRQISKLYSPMLVGMSIKDLNQSEVFNDGKRTNANVTLTVCYLNGAINNKFGDCNIQWTLYFNKKELVHEFTSINKNIKACHGNHCNHIDIFNNYNFGEFLISNASPFSFAFNISDSNVSVPPTTPLMIR